MKFETKYDVGDIVYVKSVPGMYVRRGHVRGVSIEPWSRDHKGVVTEHRPKYDIWFSDREDNGGYNEHVSETYCFDSWEDAWWEKRA